MANDSESLVMFRDSARDFLQARDQRQRVRELEDTGGGFDRDVWAEMADLGWFSVLVSETDGGLGLGLREVAAIAEEAGRQLLPEPFVDAGVHPISLLARLPATGPRDSLLSDLQSGTRVAGVAWQEHAGELDLHERTTARTDGSSLLLNGEKRFIRPAAGADGWIVSAVMDGEFLLAWVTADVAGAALQVEPGVDGLAVASIAFRDAAAQLIARGAEARDALRNANEIARIAQGAELVGIAMRALELTRDYLQSRVQFGKPIGSFQALQHRMVDALIQVELATSCLREGLASLSDDKLPSVASRVQARCGYAAFEVTRMAIQLHGAIGTTHEFDVGLYFRRAMALAARWGNPTAHRQRWARLSREVTISAAMAPPPEAPDYSPHQDWEQMPEIEFRLLVRSLFSRHYPEHRRYMPYRQSWAESKEWYLTLSRLGWLAPAWPREHGGMGLPADKLIAYIEESEAWGVARPPDQGLVMVGPILMRFGTPAQRQRFLPKVLSGEHVWTQGYSETSAGSDLAAVRTEAVLDGDDFIVNGQKTWTTWGSDGTHMFMLVRTDKSVKKQAGISFLLVDLQTPGITVRPIRNIAGEREFCEVFFDDVRVPRANLVGELNAGWTVAKALLGFERLFTGSPKHSQHTLHQVEKLAAQRGLLDDAAFKSQLVQLQMDTADLVASYTGFAAIAKRGEAIPPSISMLKIWSTETYERLALLLVQAADDYAAMRDHCRTNEIDMHVVAPIFNCMGAKIFAGSNEIQRNILAKTVLDLPA